MLFVLQPMWFIYNLWCWPRRS